MQLRFVRWFALIASLVGVAILMVIPFYSGSVSRETTGGGAFQSMRSDTLIGVNGVGVLLVLAIPVLAAANAVLPWSASYRRTADLFGTVVGTMFSAMGAMTVGLFFVPSTIALWCVVLWPRKRSE